MTNVSSEHVPETGEKGKLGSTTTKGTSVENLGACWGLDPKKDHRGGWVTQKGSQVPQLPGGLELALDEHEVHPDELD